MARYRLGDGIKRGRYWKEEKDKECRLCRRGEENWKHVWEDCIWLGTEGSWEEMLEVVVEEEGKREEWLRKLEKVRGMRGGR